MKAFSRPTLAQGEGQRFRFGEYPGPSGRVGQFFAQTCPSRWAKFGGQTPERSKTKDLRRIAFALYNERREQNVSNYSGVDALASRRPAPRSGAGFVAADGRRPLLRLAVWFATTCCCGLAKRIGRPSKECSGESCRSRTCLTSLASEDAWRHDADGEAVAPASEVDKLFGLSGCLRSRSGRDRRTRRRMPAWDARRRVAAKGGRPTLHDRKAAQQ